MKNMYEIRLTYYDNAGETCSILQMVTEHEVAFVKGDMLAGEFDRMRRELHDHLTKPKQFPGLLPK